MGCLLAPRKAAPASWSSCVWYVYETGVATDGLGRLDGTITDETRWLVSRQCVRMGGLLAAPVPTFSGPATSLPESTQPLFATLRDFVGASILLRSSASDYVIGRTLTVDRASLARCCWLQLSAQASL